MRRWILAMAMAVAAGSGLAAEEQGERHETMMGSGSERLHLTVEQVFFPGLSERVGCRMQISARNDTGTPVSLRLLVNGFDDSKAVVDTWLVPTGDLKPGEEVMRIYSCVAGHEFAVSEASPYGWPQTCVVDGNTMSPCPLGLAVTTIIQAPKVSKEEGGKKEGH